MDKKIGSLPPSLQGIALELKIGERVAVITGEHSSEKHGEHEDVYVLARIDKDNVYIAKQHYKLSQAFGIPETSTQPFSLSEEDENNLIADMGRGC
jgi:hypothetical protein